MQIGYCLDILFRISKYVKGKDGNGHATAYQESRISRFYDPYIAIIW